MDLRNWPWKMRSPEKNPDETEIPGSLSSCSHSHICSDDQGMPMSEKNHAQTSEVSSKVVSRKDTQVHEVSSSVANNEDTQPSAASSNVANFEDTLSTEVLSKNGTCDDAQSPKSLSMDVCYGDSDNGKTLAEKLSAALSNIRVKEEMVKQHAKVAEDAVSGWEKAEIEVSNLKQQLEATALKNVVLEDKISHLDEALKECVRQLQQAKEEQEEKVHEALSETRGWKSEKLKLESRVSELEFQLDFSQTEALITLNEDFEFKLEALRKENSELRLKLFSLSKQLKLQSLDRELSIKSAESASKQHLDSIRKITKLEAECRRLRAMSHKSQQCKDQRTFSASSYVESSIDSQSDGGERLPALDNELNFSDSWASALIAELNQFKSDKDVNGTNVSSVGLDLMGDFLEMERLAALPEVNATGPCHDHHVCSDGAVENDTSKDEFQHALQRTAEQEKQIERVENEKEELEILLADSRERLQFSCNQLEESDIKVMELQRELDSVHSSKESLQIMLLELQRQLDSDKAAETGLSKDEFLHALQQKSNLEEKVKRMENEREELEIILAEAQDKFEMSSRKLKESELRLLELQDELESAHYSRQSLEQAYLELQQKLVANQAAEHESKAEFHCLVSELEAKVNGVETERDGLKTLLEDTQEQLSVSNNKTRESEIVLTEMQRKLDSANFSKRSLESKLKDTEKERSAIQTQFEAADTELQSLHHEIKLLDETLEKERSLSKDFAKKYQQLVDEISRRQEAELQRAAFSNGELKLKQERELAVAAGKLAECQQTIASLEKQLKCLVTVDDLQLDAEIPENGVSPASAGGYLRKSASSSGHVLVPSATERWSRPSTALASAFFSQTSSTQ